MLVEQLDRAVYTPRCYVTAETDKLSATKAVSKEIAWLRPAAPATRGDPAPPADVSVTAIPRSREVGQSYITSVWTTVYSLLFAAAMVLQQRPRLVGAAAGCRRQAADARRAGAHCLVFDGATLCDSRCSTQGQDPASKAAAPTVRPRRTLQVLVNGPGTCVPVCAAAYLYR